MRAAALKLVAAGVAAAALFAAAPLALAQVAAGPLPQTLSPEARAALAAAAKAPQPSATSVAARRAFLSKFQDDFGARQARRYPVEVEGATLAGVPVRLIRAKDGPPLAASRLVLLNLHGGGFNADSGSLTENIPIASLTRIPVVAVLYRLMPEHVFPAQADDALAVYKALLKTHKASDIAVYGTSAGAILGPELIARIHKEGLPEPAALGMFSGDTDLTRAGDSLGPMAAAVAPFYRGYAGAADIADPAVSPSLGRLDFFPPTLCVTGTRDFYLSSTANFCRQLELAGRSSRLVVFDGLPHAFWSYLEMPESDQAFHIMADFLAGALKAPPR